MVAVDASQVSIIATRNKDHDPLEQPLDASDSSSASLPELSSEQSSESLDSFLAGVERRAFQMARVSTGDPDAALDIVQDAMLRLVKNYRHRSASEWPPLFYRVLSNAVTDWHRQRQRSWKVFDRWFGMNDDEHADALESQPGPRNSQPEQLLDIADNMAIVERAINTLSQRQQQAFMLRCWAGFSTAETAESMGCTEGTVKTLYSRAMRNVRETLENISQITD